MRLLILTLLSSALWSFLTPSARGFVTVQIAGKISKWNPESPLVKPSAVNPVTKAIRYFIAADAYSSAKRTNEINAIRAAFDQWQSVPGANVRFEFAGLIPPDGLGARYDNTNIVFWEKRSLTPDISGRRALTTPVYSLDDGSIIDADIVLNGIQFQWFTDPTDTVNQAQFVESIVLHEIGHLLGLDHSTAGGATVIDAGNGINTNSGLSADETAAARFLYPGASTDKASIRGTVRMNGSGILGAAVMAEDAAGNIAGATITQSTGAYAIEALPPGSYRLRVTPLDPSNSGLNSLQRGDEIAFEYLNAVTAFLPTTNFVLNLQAAETKTHDVNVTSANPPVRINGISKPVTQPDLVTTVRYAVVLTQGQNNFFVGVNSPNFQPGAVLTISGDGLVVGPTAFHADRVGPGINSLVVPVSVTGAATPGLRTFVVSQNGALAYANGYLEVAAATTDDNFDGLDDRFQRRYWTLWTAPEAAPAMDPDSDGFSNAFEYRTDSNPTNPLSYKLALQQPVRGRFGPNLSWMSDPGKKYQLYRSSILGGVLQPVGQTVTAEGELSSAPITFDGSADFYRLELKR